MEMAKMAFKEQDTFVRVAYKAFRISESCYRYKRKLNT
jgi:hypothetical protein